MPKSVWAVLAVGIGIVTCLWLQVLVSNSPFMGNTSSSTTMSLPPPVIVPAAAKHTATVIFLHGLGDTGHGWAQALRQIRSPHIKYVCPTAPTIPVTLNGGMRMPSWFDIFTLGEGREDEQGIIKASEMISQIISNEEKEVKSDRIVLGGFSQGGALSLYTSLTSDKKFAGLVILSSWMPLSKSFQGKDLSKCPNSATPILQGHGDVDPLVSVKWGEQTSQFLTSINPHHTFKLYPGMGHSSCDQEMNDVKEFIAKVLPGQ